MEDTISLIIGLAIYAFSSYCLQMIFTKLNMVNAWFAWIPFLNAYMTFKAGDKPGWWVALLLIPLVNLVGIVLFVMAWVEILKKLGKSPWLLFLFIVPLANLALMGYLAFG